MRCCRSGSNEEVTTAQNISGSDFAAVVYFPRIPADKSGMYLPRHIFAIQRMPPEIARAWPTISCCNWCRTTPTYFIRYRIPPRAAKRFELACAEHAREPSKQTRLGLEGAT